MKHSVAGESPLAGRERRLVIDLIPQNSIESAAITNVARGEASEDERGLVDNYLLYGLGYQVVDVLSHQGLRITLKIFR